MDVKKELEVVVIQELLEVRENLSEVAHLLDVVPENLLENENFQKELQKKMNPKNVQ